MTNQLHSLDFPQRFIDTPAVRIHYAEVESAGPPAVLLHGIGMDWRVWQAISRRLAPHFHLYLLDLRGHGESAKPRHGYTVGHYAADVEDMIDMLGLRDATLIGSSLGGMVAAAVEAPVDMVSHRILVDPPLTGGPARDAGQLQDILRLKRRPVDELADYLARSNPGAGRFLLKAMSEMWHEAADGVIEDVLAAPNTYFDIASSLRSDPAPTLIMQADPERGGILTDSQARRALELLPNGTLIRMAGAGHAIHAYKPAEFSQAVMDFVSVPAARG